MSEKNNLPGTSSMPAPSVAAYDNKFQVTDLFKHDLEIVLGDVAYVDAIKFFNMISTHNSIFTTAVLNEFIRSLSMLPYKTINPLMKVIDNEENFKKYFKLIENNSK